MFIPNNPVGKRVRLRKNVTVLKGTFTRGHEFTVTGAGRRGVDLRDDQGEELIEVFDRSSYDYI